MLRTKATRSQFRYKRGAIQARSWSAQNLAAEPVRWMVYLHLRASISFPGVSKHLRISCVCWRTIIMASSSNLAWSSTPGGEAIVLSMHSACRTEVHQLDYSLPSAERLLSLASCLCGTTRGREILREAAVFASNVSAFLRNKPTQPYQMPS